MWRRYGAGPRHMVAVLFALSFAVYGWVRIAQSTSDAAVTVLVWFVLVIIGHDLGFLPLYTAVRHLAVRLLGPRRVVLLAVPATIATLLLVAWLPLVVGTGLYRFITTLSIEPYRWRWALVAAGVFALSAVAGVLRR